MLENSDLGNVHTEEAPVPHVDQLWMDSEASAVISRLQKDEDLQSIIDGSFSQENYRAERLECCDGRCPHSGNELAIAGSGILLSDEAFDALMKQYPNLKSITTHEDCGAARLAFNQAKEQGNLPEGIVTPADYAEQWARKKALQYAMEYEHISKTEFVDEHHHERGIVLDSTGSFHPNSVMGMPNVFVSHSAAVAESEYIKTETAVLTGIALGDHGFGERVNAEEPFYIMVSAKDEAEKDRLIALVQEATVNFGDKVRVKGFVVPPSVR